MSDTNVQTVNPDILVDLFPSMDGLQKPVNPSFGMLEGDTDILSVPAPTPTPTPDTPTPPVVLDDPNKDKENPDKALENADILGDNVPNKPVGAVLNDLSAYYQDRIKNGKFVAINEEDDKGNLIPFIPKTAEEYDEVLELQINHRLEEAKKDLEQKWYESKTPAWKAISQYAELVDDPTQLIPFLQGVRAIQSVANLDENTIEGAEQIVRARLEQRGDPEEVINAQIEALKTTDKLIATGKSYKPIIIQQEQTALNQSFRQEQEEKRKYELLISDIRQAALQEIEKPIFGKSKLKQEEKAAIYDLIGEPSEETSGYGIFNAIDTLFDKKDFQTLKEIALLLTKRDSFYTYMGANVANQTAASLEKKLRLAGESRSTSGNDFDEERRGAAITRNQFKTKPSFGRG